MKSTARVGAHPIHPMLIPYPFAFLSGAFGFRLAAKVRGDATLGRTADHLRTVGVASALVAAVPGIMDYFGTVPSGRPKTTATQHALSNSSALVCFIAAALAARKQDEAAVLRFETVGTALLALGGWLGGSLSYHHHVGVVEDARGRQARMEAPRDELVREQVEVIENVGP